MVACRAMLRPSPKNGDNSGECHRPSLSVPCVVNPARLRTPIVVSFAWRPGGRRKNAFDARDISTFDNVAGPHRCRQRPGAKPDLWQGNGSGQQDAGCLLRGDLSRAGGRGLFNNGQALPARFAWPICTPLAEVFPTPQAGVAHRMGIGRTTAETAGISIDQET